MKKSVKTQGVRTNWSTPTRATVAASEGPSGVSGLISLLDERLSERGGHALATLDWKRMRSM